MNFFYYSILGGVVSFLAILLAAREFSSESIGLLIATYTVVRMLTGQLWAYLSDIKHNPKGFMQLGMLLSLLALLPSIWSSDKTLSFISIAASMTCFMSVISQLEVLTLSAANDDAVIYNRVRLFGSVGFIVSAVIVGWQIERSGPEFVLHFAVVIMALFLLFSLRLKNAEVHHSDSEDESGFWQSCLQIGFLSFMLASILLQIGFAPYVGFFTQYLANLDYPGSYVGALFALGTFSEIFLFMVAGKILARYRIKWLMFVCLALTAFRWWVVSEFADHLLVLVVSQLSHAFSFGLLHSVSIYFIRQHFPRSQQNRGQFMYLGVTYGVGGAIGAGITGVLWQDGAGGANSFVAAAIAVGLAALVILITPAKKFQYRASS